MTRLPDELSKAIAGKLQTRLQDSKEKEICFSMWDFAGQELYYTTHQVIMFFLFCFVLFCLFVGRQLCWKDHLVSILLSACTDEWMDVSM